MEMTASQKRTGSDRKMVILASYFEGETYGLLGPQMAATIIEDNTPFECIVVAVTHQDDKALLKRALDEYFGKERPVVGFSTLSGREDLFLLASELKAEGALTILAGPQADVDFIGERGWRDHPHRFQGLSGHFSAAIHGPGEQAVPFLNSLDRKKPSETAGLLYLTETGEIAQNPETPWNERHLRRVNWDNLYRVGPEGLSRLKITTAQVLQHIGCPHAARAIRTEVDYPAFLRERDKIILEFKGCSFCDVAADKGFHGSLALDTVMAQIQCLPKAEDGRTIPFELINENALPGLSRLIEESAQRDLNLSQINLTLRADWFIRGETLLREALQTARRRRIRILLSSIGLESFDDNILRNLNKGLTVETNLRAVGLMREIKERFPFQWAYSRGEGAIHGFIHPTPWDTPETAANIQGVIDRFDLSSDILPRHSIPLIIHHSSGLADWIRIIEEREEVRFERYVSVIGWWEEALLSS